MDRISVSSPEYNSLPEFAYLGFTPKAKEHMQEKGYSKYYMRNVIANPERVIREVGPGKPKYIVTGYGYGMVVQRRTDNGVTSLLALAVFTDEPVLAAA